MDSVNPTKNVRRGASRLAQQNGSISPTMVLHTLRLWWKIATPIGILLAMAAAFAVWYVFEPKYMATQILSIEAARPHLAFPDAEGSARFVETQLELLKTPTILAQLIADPEIRDQGDLAMAPDMLAYLRKEIIITAIGKSALYQVAYSSADPAYAKKVVDKLVDAYIAYVYSDESVRRTAMINTLDEIITDRKSTAENLRSQVRELAKNMGIEPPNLNRMLPGPEVISSPAASIQSRLIEAQVKAALLSAEIELEQKAIAEATDVSDAEVEQALAEPFLALKQGIESQRQALEIMKEKVTRGADTPAYKRQLEQLENNEEAFASYQKEMRTRARAALRLRRNGERDANATFLGSELATTKKSIESLQSMLDAALGESKKGRGDQVELEFQLRELDQANAVCDLLLQRKTELSTERMAPSRVIVLEQKTGSRVSSAPVKTIPYMTMMLAVALAFSAPFGVAVGWEWFVRRVNNTDDIEQQVGVDVVGEIVLLPRLNGSRWSVKRSEYGRQLFEESVDGLRTTLVLAESMRHMHVLAIASAVSSEGKTSVATELAVSIARSTGKPTLLIDGDMRAPDIHRMFDVAVGPGLADVLSGEALFEDSVVATDSPMLAILPAGMLATSPHRLLHNGAFHRLLEAARKSYEYVIIDTPPVLAASESLVLAKYADATLVCAMRDRTRLSHIKRAHARLNAAGANPIGVVLSGLPARHYASRYGSYSYEKSRAT
jgi:succinoglycan biosynthesis transport protein ExoP